MEFLSTKSEPGMFILLDCFERLDKRIDYGLFPKFEEFVVSEITNSFISFEEFFSTPENLNSFRTRIWIPGIQQSLLRRKIKQLSNFAELLEVTRKEDQENKIDLKLRPNGSAEFFLIQVKGRNLTQDEFDKETKIQREKYGKIAGYVIVGYRENNPDERPWFEYRGRVWSLEELDEMLQQIYKDTSLRF